MIVLAAGDAVLEISPRGAEVVRWCVNGCELIWQGDARSWERSAPVLFPVVGRCRDGQVRAGGTDYPMPVHGFAPDSDFTCVEISGNRARLVLRDNPASRAHWPFAFELAVDFELLADGFRQTLGIRNTGEQPMPYACGLHPGFRWPFAGGVGNDYEIVLQEGVEARVPEITPDGLFRDSSRAVNFTIRNGEQRLALDHGLFAHEALCFVDADISEIVFRRRAGAELRIAMTGFPHLALWSRNGGAFLCIESWTGHGDRETFSGDIFAKPSMRVLEAGDCAEHSAYYAVSGL